MKEKILILLIGLFIYSCSNDPKSKLYNKETVNEDLLNFTDEEKELIKSYVLTETIDKLLSGDTSSITSSLESLTYEDMILTEQQKSGNK